MNPIIRPVVFTFILTGLLLSVTRSFSQAHPVCANPRPVGPILTVPDNYNSRTQNISGMRMIRLFIHVTRPEFPNSPPAQQESEILAHLQFMQQFYAPFGICFIIQGFDEIVNDDIAFIDAKAGETPALLQPYLRPNCLNIFIHNSLGAGSLIGTAYTIPSTFVSLKADYVWTGYNILAAHEVGHCLGLFHTFEDEFGVELVARNGACSNCSTAGDKICDTPADIQFSDANFSNCVFNGNWVDSCNNPYVTDPSNLMSYYEFLSCVDLMHFTPNQGTRANYYIDNTPALMALLLTDNAVTETTNHDYSAIPVELVYRNSITINASSYVARDAARLQMSSEEITIKPGAHFYPNNNGIVVLRANTMCQ
jgi:Pregnancy-associated plasma protein-A